MDIEISKINETHVRVKCESGIAQELSDAFTFTVPNYRFTPAYRDGRWDGKIRMFDRRRGQISAGLVPKIIDFAKTNGYQVSGFQGQTLDVPEIAQIEAWAGTLGTPGIIPRDYQIAALRSILELGGRGIILSATGSGKSFSIYLLFRYFNKKTLLIVPTVGLVKQMYSDLRSYGYTEPINVIHADAKQVKGAQITIATWQSIFRKSKSWFAEYETVIGDEVHTFRANSLVTLMDKCENASARIGLSGTLDDSKISELTLIGLFGTIKTVATTADLIQKKILSNLNIQCLLIDYSDEEKKEKRPYRKEIDFLVLNKRRNAIICNLVSKLKGNTLVLFQYVEKHGKELCQLMKRYTNRPVYYISGEISAEEREEIRKKIDNEEDAILIASSGTTSTGLNIVSLKNIVFTSPSKAKIKTLQSIGRVLRRSERKTTATLWDIADDLVWKSRKNHTYKHFLERLAIYSRESFSYKVHKINIR